MNDGWLEQMGPLAGPLGACSLLTLMLILERLLFFAGHGFRIWADAYLATLQQILNQVHLAIDGVIHAPDEWTGNPSDFLLHRASPGETA